MGTEKTVLQRLKIELNNKQYYDDGILGMYLSENGLDELDVYFKDNMQKQLLQTVYSVLETLSNNIDVFRSVETEFATVGQAYQYLEKRLQILERKILSIPDDSIEGASKNIITFLYHD